MKIFFNFLNNNVGKKINSNYIHTNVNKGH